jgi:hypothetical protein
MTLTDGQIEEMRRVKGYFPFRIIYGAFNPVTKEFVASAVSTMRIPNKLMREGWEVFTLKPSKVRL